MKPAFKILTNKFLLTGIAFLLLMMFFDQNDWFTQHAREQELEQLQQKIDHIHSEKQRMEQELAELSNNPAQLEKLAREKYHFKKEDEDLYLIVEDTLINK